MSSLLRLLNTRLHRVFGPNISRITQLVSPILLIHGSQDEVIPRQHSLLLHEKLEQQWKNNEAAGPWNELHIIEGARHNDIETKFCELYLRRLRNFVDRCMEGL